MALATDYDVWHHSEAVVTVEAVVAVLLENVAIAKSVLRRLVPSIGPPRTCGCAELLRNAVITAPAAFPAATRRRLDLLIGKYFPRAATVPRAPHRPGRKEGRRGRRG